jgi:predicted CXXCH cytochrome family protein
MKKLFIIFAALALTTGAFGQNIAGSVHDFSGDAWSGGEICIACHTPHNALTAPDGPLWNHELTAATFTTYSSSTLDATIGQPGGVSKLCLSCHDGTVAIDSFGGATGSIMITGNALLGTSLSNDHPISITYDTALANADGELADPSTVTSGLGGTITADMLFSDQMECASCHDVHNTVTTGTPSLLRINNAGSALCLKCHLK